MFGWKEILLNSRLFLWLVKSVSHPFVTYPYQETYETSIRCRQTVPPEILSCGKWLQSNGKWTPSSNKLNKLFFPNKTNGGFLIHFNRIFHYKRIHFGVPPVYGNPQIHNQAPNRGEVQVMTFICATPCHTVASPLWMCAVWKPGRKTQASPIMIKTKNMLEMDKWINEKKKRNWNKQE